MKLGIMQPYFFPYIGYWQLINEVDTYIIYDDVNFIKGGWINRNRILVNGNPLFFNVQMKNPSSFKKINEIELSNDLISKRKMLSTLEMNYKKAPFFQQVYPLLKDIIEQDEDNLAKYLEYSIRKVCEYLNIDTRIIMSSSIEKNNELKGKEKVIHICKLLRVSDYVNAIGGQELYDYESFENNGIQLNFLKTNQIEYTQLKNDFVSNLSIIDVLMFNSKEQLTEILNNYEIINDKKKVKTL